MTALSILGLLPQTATVTGSARFEGIELLDAPAAHLRDVRGQRISFVFQEPMTSLNPVLRVGQQVAEVVRRHNDVSRGEARARRSSCSTSCTSPTRSAGSTSTPINSRAGCASA